MMACTDESVQIFCFSISMKNYCLRKCLSLVHHSFQAFALFQEELVINGAPSLIFFISYESCRTADVLLTRQNVEKQENFFLLLYIFYFRRQVLEGCYLIFI